MLSFVLTNILLVPSLITGHVPCEQYKELDSQINIEAQEIKDISGSAITIQRDNFSVVDAPVVGARTAKIQSVPLGASNSSLLNSAMKYVGSYWDCTYLVEQALRDLGYSVPDLGPMQFGSFGTVFNDPSQVQPGDIMMRGGHVAIYAGDGIAIQGGFGFGGVVITSIDANPNSYYSFVRLN